MSQKNLYICPKCFQFHVLKENAVFTNCSNCNAALDLVHYDYERYAQMDEEAKKSFRLQYIERHYSRKSADGFVPMRQSGWVSYLGCLGWVSVVSIMLAGVFFCLRGAFLAGLGLIIAGPVSGGALILLSIIAEDVRHIRNQVDRMHYEKENHQ